MVKIQRLLEEYKETLIQTKKLYKSAELKEDQLILLGIIRNLNFSIDWMETGWMPPFNNSNVSTLDPKWIGHLMDSKNPFIEIEERIDKELEEERSARTSRTYSRIKR